MDNSIVFTSEQKMHYNLNFVKQYRNGIICRQQDLKQQIQAAQARLNNINVDNPDWLLLWKSCRPTRPIHALFDALEFYLLAEKFLESKEEEIELAIEAKMENSTDPVRMACHQVKHKELLEKLEQSSESDCEEMLTELWMGMMMENEGDRFRVS